jgi:pantothenate kinase type III
MYLFFLLLLIVLGLVGAGTAIELSTIGDEDDFKGGDIGESLYLASLFRRLYQYDAILLQRKKPWARKLTCFSILRGGINLNL